MTDTEALLLLADALCDAACEVCNQEEPCDPYRCHDSTEIAQKAVPVWTLESLAKAATAFYNARNPHMTES